MLRFLSLKSFRNRKFVSFLCVLSVALSLSLFLTVEKLRNGIEEGFTNSISNADLIVGARSGPLQLLLYSIFHIGSPTNNISTSSFEKIKNHPAVAWTIPLSLGDSYRGHRVVATNDSFFKHYQFHGDEHLEIREGKWIRNTFDVVLGSQVANSLGHSLNDSLVLSHGISKKSVFQHEKTPFKVVGVLKPTGTPLDKSLYITLYGMEALHIGWEGGVPNSQAIAQAEFKQENLSPDQITAFVLKTKNRIALLGLQRFISTYEEEALSAIIPAMTLTELWGLLDQLENAFLGISLLVIIIGFLTILISLYISLNERRREMAILRSVGVSVKEITLLLVIEATLLSIMGAVLGLLLQYLLLGIAGPFLEAKYALHIPILLPSLREILVILGFIFFGSLFGLVPAVRAYKTSLNTGLSN